MFLFSTGHQGKQGHEFYEFEFHPNGKFRYANNRSLPTGDYDNKRKLTMDRREGNNSKYYFILT